MPKVHPPATVGASPDDIEAAFYKAMRSADIGKLMACWADEDEIVCVHPGGPRLMGAGAIRAAFDLMFVNGNIQAWPEGICQIESLTSVVRSVRERIEVRTDAGLREAYVIATNVYHKTAQGWRMVVHHASPGSAPQGRDANDVPHIIH